MYGQQINIEGLLVLSYADQNISEIPKHACYEMLAPFTIVTLLPTVKLSVRKFYLFRVKLTRIDRI
jgi:hypothetical protein